MLRRRRAPLRDGDVVIVTGASRGIGLEVARRFAALGARVGLIARDRAALEAAKLAVNGTVHAAAADVADRDQLAAALDTIDGAIGPPTVLVNNAGIGQWSAVVDTDVDVFRRLIDVNFLGAVNATAHVLPGMLGRGRGRIVNVASIAGRIGAPFEAAYSASKFALVGYSEALAVELAGTGVAVSLVNPGPVDTGFFDERGHDYELTRPRPIPPGRVADTIVEAALGGRAERFVPAWLGFAHVAKTAVPSLYRRSTGRLYSRQRRQLGDRFRR
jgi:short-subunit dehydrogenase